MNIRISVVRLLTVFVLSTVANALAAQVAPPLPDSLSLAGQYQTLLRKSKTQLDYKLINPYRLSILWKNVNDSLRIGKRKITDLQQQLDSQTKLIASQKAELLSKEQSLSISKSQVDEVNVAGIQVNKVTYNLVVWGLILALSLALGIVIYRSVSYRKEAKYRVKLFEELSGEFQSYKVKSNEKEKKLARELQDERNKLDDLLKK